MGTLVTTGLTTGLITALISIVSSLAIARLTFHFVKEPELARQFQHQFELKERELAQQLENKKVELQASFDFKRQELSESLKNELETERAKRELDQQEQIRRKVIEWSNPIIIAVEELSARLSNIIDTSGHGPLSEDWDSRRPRDWANTHEYFMKSTLYIFARYFARESMLREYLGADAFRSQADKDALLDSLLGVVRALSSYPAPYNLANCPGGDTQVFFFQQRAMGEVLITRDDDKKRLQSYVEFLNQDQQVLRHFEPLVALLVNLAPDPKGNCRWSRIQATQLALQEVRSQCERLLGLQGDEK